ncbi:MAG: hypothetical protein M0Z46_05195 [Actinomycetota bacterium]|nr:hypothetical protein [Actinomycetota bacterium]
MHDLTQERLDPAVVLAALVTLWDVAGLHRLAGRSVPSRTKRRRRRSFAFYGGVGAPLLFLSVAPRSTTGATGTSSCT